MQLDAVEATAEIFSVRGKTVVVTGATSGLGARFAQVLAAAGAKVVVTGRRRERLERLAAGAGDHVLPVAADVTDEEDCEALIAAARSRFGAVDVLVNNAGVGGPEPAEREALVQWRAVMEVNVTAAFLLSQLVARDALDRGRQLSIVNVASMMGVVASAPIPQASYCASKAAVIGLTRELACQWARRGIRVNAIAPGWFPSEMTHEMFEDERSMQFVRRNCPMGRPGAAHELDGVLLFLCSESSSYMTGQTLVVDGGWTAR